MLSFKIAARFLKSSPGQSALIMAGIAVGIATQIFVGSLITSLQADLIDSAVGSSAHITLLPGDGQTTVPGNLAAEASGSETLVSTAVPVRTLSGIFVDSDDSVPLSITGGDAGLLDTIYGLSERMTQGSFRLGEGEVVVGTVFSEKYGIEAGDELDVLLPSGSPATYEVSGVFDLGQATANERFAFVDAGSAADALGMDDDEYSAVQIQLTDVFASSEVAARLADEFDVEAADWQAENEQLLSGLAAQSGSSAMIQAFVLIAVALGIASTLAISAVQKTRQIGILKAIGMGDAAAGRIFLWQAALLGVGGTLGGIALGYALIALFGVVPVPFSIRPEPGFIALSAGIGITVALLSSVIPARSTSRLDPIEVIQNG
ncbi:MAG: ABC transporter permease [Coriobacteriia bacterium]|nr:ABC transporter permease [Coriobacteriia bacterium]MBN2840469.1 ABC transporter permease [Coriobacteriia bacterium]